MQIVKSHYYKQIHAGSIISTCFACNPAMYQAFTAQDHNFPLDYEYLRLRFVDWEYLGYEENHEDNNELLAEAITIEVKSIDEIEQELVSLLPVIPEMFLVHNDIYAICRKGYECFFQNDYLKAIEYYTIAANYELNDDIVFCLSMAYYMNGEFENAIRTANAYKGEFVGFDRFGNDKYDTDRIDTLFGILERKMTKAA